MKIVTCTGYFSTGSSAVVDLLSEYSGIYAGNEYELRFVYDLDGLSDLEYHLVENHNRHNSGHAIKRYRKLVDFYCGTFFAPKNEKYFHNQWKALSEEYLNQLTEFSFQGTWLYDYLDRGVSFHYFNSLLRKIFHKDLLAHEMTPCSYPSKEKFESLTREYIRKLFSAACDGRDSQYAYFAVDQILPPSDIQRYLPLFDDITVYITDRDPRDVFFLEKYIIKRFVIPTEVKSFCAWYEYTRRHRQHEQVDTEKSMLIHFEDFIYHYEDTVSRIEKHLGLFPSMHTAPRTRLIPEHSENNTQIWKRLQLTEQQKQEVKYIEEHLSKFLYDFPAFRQSEPGAKIG